MYASVEQKAFTLADRCDEAFLIAKFEGIETSIKIHAADGDQIISLLKRLTMRLEKGKGIN
ncbi:MAG: hypothetical protein P8123_10330 [bacterium]|jgi:hypothetical protein